MIAYYILTQAGILTLLMTSSPLVLLMLAPTLPSYAQASSMSSEARCKFPRFLQTRRNRHWMMNQSVSFATFEVDGGKIFARHGACVRSGDYSRPGQPGMGAECRKLNYTRVCLERRPGNKYLVRHVESDFDDKYMCLEFLRRGVSVVQVKMSLIQGEQFVAHLCNERYMHVGAWPWISEEQYRSAPVRCPFSGGYNLRLKYASPPPARRQGYYGSQAYYGPSYYSRVSTDPRSEDCVDSTTAPIRMESDCVRGEGVVFNFKHQSCLPADTEMALQQRALCMATWRSGRELFAMLRADNNDRAFFCLRVSLQQKEDRDPRDMTTRVEMESLKIDEVMLFLGWVCPTSSYADSSSSSSLTGSTVSPLSTPHMALSVQDQQVITEPCSDHLSLCHDHPSFCQHLHCMRTCGQCTPAESRRESASSASASASSSVSKKATIITRERFSVQYAKHKEWAGLDLSEKAGREFLEREPDHLEPPHIHTQRHNFKQKCTFPEKIRGTWLRRLSDGNDEKIVITDSTFNHPRLGMLECVTFTPPGSSSAPLQRVLWGSYKNGCYPRFTCVHFNTPARSVMRYRLADMQLWPLLLSDDDICDQRHFMEPPDMYQPGDRYTLRSWEVVRRSGHIHRLACILPHYIPRVVSFTDARGRSGCLLHGTYYTPRDIALTFFPQRSRPPSSPEHARGRGRAENPDVSGETRDVVHRKLDGDHGRKGFDGDGGHGISGRRKVISIPHPDDVEKGHNSRGFDYGGYDRQGQKFPDDVFISSKDENSNHENDPPEKEEWGDNWNENSHPDTELEEDRREHDWESSYRINFWKEHHETPFEGLSDDSDRRDHRYRRSSSSKGGNSRKQVSYQCLAVMTYVDSYKSLLTVTSHNPREVLCWVVVNASTLVIVKTSSCNSRTARQILDTSPGASSLHKDHAHNILYLHQGEHDCEAKFPADLGRPEPVGYRDEESGACAFAFGGCGMVNVLASLCVLTVVEFFFCQL